MDAFGRWPGFHDGEVYKIALDRTRQLSNGGYYPSIDLYDAPTLAVEINHGCGLFGGFRHYVRVLFQQRQLADDGQ